MKTILEQMWYDYNLAFEFKKELINKGYIFKDVLFLEGILFELNKLILNESFDVLNELLRKTYYRILKRIDKGHNFLLDIINYPDLWRLVPIENYSEAWIKNDVLIFTTEAKCAVFTKNKSIDNCYKYDDNKWQ